MKKIKKAILPVAGKGTRMMPLTMHQPKGMIALADKPLIHYVLDEMRSAGIEEVVMVLGKNQEVFKQYINHLKQEHAWNGIKFHFAYQAKPLGDGDAVYSARKFIKNGEPFIVAFCDDIFSASTHPLSSMIAEFEKSGRPTILLEKVPMSIVSRFGVVKTAGKKGIGHSITGLVEKPKIEEAPSNMTIVGRYALPYEIFEYIKKQYPYKEQEIKLAFAFQLYLKDNPELKGVCPKTIRFDCGSKEGLVRAQAHFALNHPQFKNIRAKLI
jgi:UTP--glucose-1-phosphate uridylyltransferase